MSLHLAKIAMQHRAKRATCTITHGVTSNDTTDGAVNTPIAYATGALTPAANDLLIVFVRWNIASGSQTGTAAVTNSAGLTFTKISETGVNSIHIATALAANSSQTCTATITPGATTAVGGCNITVIRVAGMAKTGSSASRQVRSATFTAGNAPAVSFLSAALSNNPILGMAGNSTSPSGITQPSTWTQLNNSGFSTPTTGIETTGLNSGFSGTAVTWGSTSATNGTAFVLELDNT